MATKRSTQSVEQFDTLPNSALIPATAAAAVLGVSTSTIWRKAKAGELTAIKVGENSTRFQVGEIRRRAGSGKA